MMPIMPDFYQTKSDPRKAGHPNKHSFVVSKQIRTPTDCRKKLIVYAANMQSLKKEMAMEKGKKRKRAAKVPEKKKVLKIGGLWVDSLSFPSFDDEQDPDPPSRQ
jgi:hypothetical protein